MPITLYRYGSPRSRDELVRIGVARQVPRGVRKEEWQPLGYFDVRLPLLAPSPALIKAFRHEGLSFPAFEKRYRTEMKAKESAEVIDLLAALLPFQSLSLGCFCEEESRCHRSLLKALIEERAKERAAAYRTGDGEGEERFASPICYAPSPEEE